MLPSCRGEAVCRHAACPDHLPCHNHARPSTDSPGCPFSAQGSGLVCFTTTGVQPILCVLCKITRMYLFSIQETERCLNRCGNHLRCQKGIVGYLSVCLSLSVLMCVCVCVCVSASVCVCLCVCVWMCSYVSVSATLADVASGNCPEAATLPTHRAPEFATVPSCLSNLPVAGMPDNFCTCHIKDCCMPGCPRSRTNNAMLHACLGMIRPARKGASS